MDTTPHPSAAQTLAFIRDETRFEISLLHQRVDALIGGEAFLTIAFTAAMSNANPTWGNAFALTVGPLLSFLGCLLALLAWPGVHSSFQIILAWNTRQNALLAEFPELSASTWRPAVAGHSADPDQRYSMIFVRAVPAVFAAAWFILGGMAVYLAS